MVGKDSTEMIGKATRKCIVGKGLGEVIRKGVREMDETSAEKNKIFTPN